jgi:hypothetical protein
MLTKWAFYRRQLAIAQEAVSMAFGLMTQLAMNESTHCRNCGAATAGNYCQQCGQETRLHAPSLGEFLHEFVGHYVALEGRLWGSITRLLFRPGLLTNEYLAGRRKRYVEPLRLYLSLSIIFFAVMKFGGAELVTLDPPAPTPVQQSAASAPVPILDQEMEQSLSRQSPRVAHAIRRFSDMNLDQRATALQAAAFSFGPYALFLMMPFFALWLKMLYLGSGRRYGEHLLFALHSNAFAFIAIGAFVLMPDGFLKFLLFCWIAGYLPWAMQRVYHKGRWGTAWRWLLLMLLHGAVFVVALLAVMAAGVLTVH